MTPALLRNLVYLVLAAIWIAAVAFVIRRARQAGEPLLDRRRGLPALEQA